MKYTINLVRTLREEEHLADVRRARIATMSMISFSVLGLVLIYSVFQVLAMEATLRMERQQVTRLEAEYKRYKETQMIVDKSDVELLAQLLNTRIYWTRKIAAMAHHLPENYWITEFKYGNNQFDVKGYGYIAASQGQLITIDDYLNLIRADALFNDVFQETYLNSTERTDEETRERVSFDYSSIAKK
jgi:Tfp pilus assembly protein PilN